MIWWETGRPPGAWTTLGGGFSADYLPPCPQCAADTGTHCYAVTDELAGPCARNGWSKDHLTLRFPSAHTVRWMLYTGASAPARRRTEAPADAGALSLF